MDIKNFQSILKSIKVTTINNLAGTNFSIYECPKKVKLNIIIEECKIKSVKLCESEEDQILAIYKDKKTYNNEQSELIKILSEHGFIATPIE